MGGGRGAMVMVRVMRNHSLAARESLLREGFLVTLRFSGRLVMDCR